MGEGVGDGSVARPMAVLRRAVRWQPRSYPQVWAIAAAGYLVCPVIVIVVTGWPRAGGAAFVTAALIWSGVGSGQSYRLHRRRTG
jgi:hypothetical protein